MMFFHRLDDLSYYCGDNNGGLGRYITIKGLTYFALVRTWEENDAEIITNWLVDNVDATSWIQVGYTSHLIWGFKDEITAMAFKLRWT